MTESGRHGPTFDRVALIHIERYWWFDEQAVGLAKLLQHLLAPDDGRAWFRAPDGSWTHVDPSTWDGVVERIQEAGAHWLGGDKRDPEHHETLRDEGRCTVLVDADRFRTCVAEPERLPPDFYVTFEVDWTYNPDARGTVLTPRLMVSSGWPASEASAPPEGPPTPPLALSAGDAGALLEDGFLFGVATAFRGLEEVVGLATASLVLDDRPQRPPIFYYASPTRRPAEGADYLTQPYLEAAATLGRVLLDSPDIRSTEITGGVMEGALAVFDHSPTVQAEYCLLMPLAGIDEVVLEDKVRFVTSVWHEIDFDATWEVYDITTDLEEEQHFFALWMGSLDTAMTLNETLFSLLRKVSIQARMFALAELLNGFLANLHARTYAGAKKRTRFRRSLEWAISSSQDHAQRRFTVRGIPGLALPRNISDGYTRAYRAFEGKIGQAVDRAHALSAQIEDVSKSLSYTAGLEEARQERDRKALAEREERAAKRLNLVLALVAVLAAIPLIVGQFDNTALSQAIPWFPFGVGLHFSFWTATVAFVATVGAIVLTLVSGKASADGEGDGPIDVVNRHANTLFDAYRSYEHPSIRSDLFHAQDASPDADAEVRAACQRAHAFDLHVAMAVAGAYEQAAEWGRYDGLPESDDEWARSMEARVCRFVLLSHVFDLRPEGLYLPLTLCLHRLRYEAGGLGNNPVSDWEFNRSMRAFGFTMDDIREVEAWAALDEVAALSPTAFVDACVARGITVAHRLEPRGEPPEEPSMVPHEEEESVTHV